MGPVRIVLVGGSFGGLTTAYELRRHLSPERAEPTLVARDDQLRFVVSYPKVAMGRRRLEQASFPLVGPLADPRDGRPAVGSVADRHLEGATLGR